jgi:hypothetical protein
MRNLTGSPARRLASGVLGTVWVATLAVACGGDAGDDFPAAATGPAPSAAGVAGPEARAGTGADTEAALPRRVSAQARAPAPAASTATWPTSLLQRGHVDGRAGAPAAPAHGPRPVPRWQDDGFDGAGRLFPSDPAHPDAPEPDPDAEPPDAP